MSNSDDLTHEAALRHGVWREGDSRMPGAWNERQEDAISQVISHLMDPYEIKRGMRVGLDPDAMCDAVHHLKKAKQALKRAERSAEAGT